MPQRPRHLHPSGSHQRHASASSAKFSIATAIAVLVTASGLTDLPASAASAEEPIEPIPQTHNTDPARIRLGRQLFSDPRLSGDGTVECSSCHDLAKGGADGRACSAGIRGVPAEVNAPTVLNAALNFWQFRRGRAETLEIQIDQVIHNPNEMGSTWEGVVAYGTNSVTYRQAFSAAYMNGVTKANIQNAIATFERSLITTNSRFDKFLRGDTAALSDSEKSGYSKFKRFGCTACHQGVNVGGNMFQRFGVMGDYFAARGNPTRADLGRYLVTNAEADRHVFKVPSLRNVALTAPYFHDASAKTLDAAVDTMFKYQHGRVASKEDRRAIVDFLGTLTGELALPP